MCRTLSGFALTVVALAIAMPLHGQGQVKPPAAIVTPDGQRVIIAEGNQISVIDAQTQKELIRIAGHTGPVTSLTIAPDGKIFASGSTDKSIRLFELATGKEIRRFVSQATVIGLSFSPDGKSLTSREADMVTKVWDVATGQLIEKSKQ